jgi:hypothetical protein
VKKFSYIFSLTIAFVFLLSVSGINVYKHYCGDFLAETSIYIQTNPCADEGGEDACSKGKAKSCCDDEVEFLQLDVDLVQSQNQKVDFNSHNYIIEFVESISLNNKKNISLESDRKRAPPLISEEPIYKRLNRFTFYG